MTGEQIKRWRARNLAIATAALIHARQVDPELAEWAEGRVENAQQRLAEAEE